MLDIYSLLNHEASEIPDYTFVYNLLCKKYLCSNYVVWHNSKNVEILAFSIIGLISTVGMIELRAYWCFACTAIRLLCV